MHISTVRIYNYNFKRYLLFIIVFFIIIMFYLFF